MEGPKKLAQYSFIGFGPRLIVKAIGNNVEVCDGIRRMDVTDDPLPYLREILKCNKKDYNGFRLIGGAIGYFSYDAIRYWERLPEIARNDLNLPDMEFAIYDDGIVFDHIEGKVYYYYSEADRLKYVNELLKSPSEIRSLKSSEPRMNLKKEVFEEKVRNVKDYIKSGDILQVVLSKRYEFDVNGDLLSFYRSLRDINPSPYMYFLKMEDTAIVGSSPEMLMRVEEGMVETYPIAGTCPRVEDEVKNKSFAEELLTDPKERAEHLMLVDLARNDVGKVSEFGSVKVPQFMEVHEYSHVQHIVSKVTGKIKLGYDSFDALRAIFPAGTVSGAPKIRAMEIIEESEPTRRGPYAGAIGYFSFNGNSDFAITIRTLVVIKNRAYIQVGAGIVADSIPEREWYETDHKAQALIKALETSV